MYNNWIPAKTGYTMGYFTRGDIPFHYALADAFTICDQYFCSVQGPTNPNRLYQWTGMIDPQRHRRRTGHRQQRGRLLLDHLPGEAAGRGRLAGGSTRQPDNFDDNPLAWFNQFKNAATD